MYHIHMYFCISIILVRIRIDMYDRHVHTLRTNHHHNNHNHHPNQQQQPILVHVFFFLALLHLVDRERKKNLVSVCTYIHIIHIIRIIRIIREERRFATRYITTKKPVKPVKACWKAGWKPVLSWLMQGPFFCHEAKQRHQGRKKKGSRRSLRLPMNDIKLPLVTPSPLPLLADLCNNILNSKRTLNTIW